MDDNGRADDQQTGVAVRFIRHWKPEEALAFTEADHAFMIAVYDTRDCLFVDKFRDALAFLQCRRGPSL